MIWNDKTRDEYGKETQQRPWMIAWRRSGRSTHEAFRNFTKCYDDPGEWVQVIDHGNTPQTNKLLLQQMKDMADQLGYFQMEFDPKRIRVRLNLDIQENPNA